MKLSEEYKQATPARIGIGRSGARYPTKAYLSFLADQAAAADAVTTEVTKEQVEALGVMEVQTKCKDKYEMITRPDWGRIFPEEMQKKIKEHCLDGVDVQIYFGDGLSAPAIPANASIVFEKVKRRLERENLTVGTPFFVRYCRVNTARTIGPLLHAKVVCVLIGERPGMLTDESMSAYIAYRPHPEMLESEYTVVANISRQGMPPEDAAEKIIEIIHNILKYSCSGVELAKQL
ncbi:MAG: ethanolamine ammonia-lyase subunit EutC [Lachnospiraceae bacterium]